LSYFAEVLAKEKLTYQEQFFFETIAIATYLKDYRASFFVNQKLFIELEKIQDLIVDQKSKSLSKTYTQFSHKDELSGVKYYLIANKSLKGALFSSLKNFDFVFIVLSDEDDIDVYSLLDKLRDVPDFQAALHVNKMSKKDERQLNKIIEI
jgi:hypothetical protein